MSYDSWLTSAAAYEHFAGLDISDEDDPENEEDPFAGPDDPEDEEDYWEDDEDLYLGILG